MSNMSNLPQYIVDILLQRLPDEMLFQDKINKINSMTDTEIFKEWCEWEGFINYSDIIKRAHDAIFIYSKKEVKT